MTKRRRPQDIVHYKIPLEQSDSQQSQDHTNSRKKTLKDKKNDKYQCGNPSCNKIYHSYTAFYNHCKKAHDGQFPQNSLINGKCFQGPDRKRGRPRITKADVKNADEIEAMKSQNQLIEFLGTINLDREEKKEDVIISVQNATEQMEKAISIVKQWGIDDKDWVNQINRCNQVISAYDLPEFYDPIQSEKYQGQVDTYNFTSIIKFLQIIDNRLKCSIQKVDLQTIKIITIVWLARIIAVSLLAEVIYTLEQQRTGKSQLIEKDYFIGKSHKFLEVIGKFFKCYQKGRMSAQKDREKQKQKGLI